MGHAKKLLVRKAPQMDHNMLQPWVGAVSVLPLPAWTAIAIVACATALVPIRPFRKYTIEKARKHCTRTALACSA
jgi:hypothetical protein